VGPEHARQPRRARHEGPRARDFAGDLTGWRSSFTDCERTAEGAGALECTVCPETATRSGVRPVSAPRWKNLALMVDEVRRPMIIAIQVGNSRLEDDA